jgi:putative ABC transport system permease protein
LDLRIRVGKINARDMKLGRLIVREIAYRKLSFFLGVVAVSAAVACLVSELTMLRQYDARTEQIVQAKEAETRQKMAQLEDDYRKITLRLGFNVLILPKEQSLGDLFAEDDAVKYMPEEYAERLARSRVATIQHLLPSLQQKLKWPERERTIILIGVRGEVPILHADPKKPLLEAVPRGTLVAGWELHRSLQLKTGERVKLLGREFTVGKLLPERGTKDDITLWINLKEAQEMLAKPGLINGILALECVCAADSLDKVRGEISQVLPDTQVIEFQSQTLARAEARSRAAKEAGEAVGREKINRARLRQERESFAAILAPTVSLGAAVWIGLLSLGNVRERRTEIGLLRALGLRSSQILAVFLGRAVLIGLAGACLGYGAGLLVGFERAEGPIRMAGQTALANVEMFFVVLASAALVAALAAWLPALKAAQEDPASVLSRE